MLPFDSSRRAARRALAAALALSLSACATVRERRVPEAPIVREEPLPPVPLYRRVVEATPSEPRDGFVRYALVGRQRCELQTRKVVLHRVRVERSLENVWLDFAPAAVGLGLGVLEVTHERKVTDGSTGTFAPALFLGGLLVSAYALAIDGLRQIDGREQRRFVLLSPKVVSVCSDEVVANTPVTLVTQSGRRIARTSDRAGVVAFPVTTDDPPARLEIGEVRVVLEEVTP